MRLVCICLALADAIHASPVFGGDCNSGTLDEYIALGSTGCQFQGYSWRDFTFSGTIGGAPIDPASIDITFGIGSPVTVAITELRI